VATEADSFRIERPFASQAPATSEPNDAETQLRRQLSRLQRQLADAQREIAHRDEELAASAEKRQALATTYDVLVEQLKKLRGQLQEAAEYRIHMEGVEQRLQDAVAKANEQAHLFARERAERGALAQRFDELSSAFDRARAEWKVEAIAAEEHHARAIAKLEADKRVAVEEAEAAAAAATARLRQAHDAELAQLRASHQRSLTGLRGEVEPQRNHAAEMARLTNELTTHARQLAERDEQHARELVHLASDHAAALANQTQMHASELARANEELVAQAHVIAQAHRDAQIREQLWEQRLAEARASEARLQQQVAEASEQHARHEGEKHALEQRVSAALQSMEEIIEEKRQLAERLDAAEIEARNNALDRERFAAYLEEGLALIGARPPDLEAVPGPRAHRDTLESSMTSVSGGSVDPPTGSA